MLYSVFSPGNAPTCWLEPVLRGATHAGGKSIARSIMGSRRMLANVVIPADAETDLKRIGDAIGGLQAALTPVPARDKPRAEMRAFGARCNFRERALRNAELQSG